MTRPVATVLLALTLLLVIFPLTLGKPGMPAALKSDEPAYYLAALSLARDGDLRLELEDVDRAFREFPFRKIDNLILMTDDGWQTIFYGKPYLYSLFAVPFAGPFGANGLLCFNLLLLAGMVWLGAIYLARFNPPWLAALFSAGFFLLSNGFAYAFWLHPEVFSMAAVTASLFLGFHRWGDGEGRESGTVALLLSGAALSLAAYNKPMLAGLGLVFAVRYFLRKDFRRLAAWLGGAALAMAAAAGLAVLLTGHPTSYLGVRRQGVTLCEPGRLPIGPAKAVAAIAEGPASGTVLAPGGAPTPGSGAAPAEPPASASQAPTGTGGAWSWIFTLPTIRPLEFRDNLVYFFFGRHTGLFLYSPFALLALWLFAVYERRSLERWLLLLSAAAIAFFFLAYIPANWQGGGGFVGNRYFILAYPAFLFLVTRIAPPALVVGGFALGSLFLGPVLLTPFGAGGPEPTLQSHVRNAPFRYFPLEQTLREVPGYLRADLGEAQFSGRRDVFLPQGDRIWLRGASASELWVAALRPFSRFAFEVRNLAPRNRIELELAGTRQVLDFGEVPPEGEARRVMLEVAAPSKVRGTPETPVYLYRFDVRAADGRIRHWTRVFPPDYCPYFAANESFEESFFVGVELTFLGEAGDLEKDVYRVAWGSVAPQAPVTPGSPLELAISLTNTSAEIWRRSGVARVRLAHRWLDAGGAVVAEAPERVELPLPLAPTESATVALPVTVPAAPGSYALEVDLVLETVAWFSARGAPTLRVPLELTAGRASAPPRSAVRSLREPPALRSGAEPPPAGVRRRVLIVSHSLGGGGAERFASTLARHLDRSDFEVAIAVATNRGEYSVPEDVFAAPLGYDGPWSLPRTVVRLGHVLEDLAPDVVLSNVVSTSCLAGAALSRMKAPPPWLARIGNAPEHADPWYQRLWAARVYPRAAALVTNSAGLVASVERTFPDAAGRCRVLYTPTDFDRLDALAAEASTEPADERPTVVWMGRLVPQKRPERAIYAFAEVRRELDARLLMLGEGPLEAPLRALIGRLGLADSVELGGFAPNPFAVLARARLFLLTSDFEGMPNALIEAQGLGVPAVSTRCPHGPEEIIENGRTGTLVELGHAAGLAPAMLQVLADEQQWQEMSAAARARARSLFDLSVLMPRWEALLAEIAGTSATVGRPGRGPAASEDGSGLG